MMWVAGGRGSVRIESGDAQTDRVLGMSWPPPMARCRMSCRRPAQCVCSVIYWPGFTRLYGLGVSLPETVRELRIRCPK